MASNGTNGNGNQLLVVDDTGGVTLIDPSTPLKRLNYFDGKFLRASDFDVEQGYLRQLVALSNQGLGSGVVYGYDTTLGSGDTIQIGPGLAIDPSGKVLLMQATATQSIQALIDASKKLAPSAPDASGKTGAGTFNDCIEVAAPPPTTVIAVSDIYVIAICSAEASVRAGRCLRQALRRGVRHQHGSAVSARRHRVARDSVAAGYAVPDVQGGRNQFRSVFTFQGCAFMVRRRGAEASERDLARRPALDRVVPGRRLRQFVLRGAAGGGCARRFDDDFPRRLDRAA